MAGMIYFVVRHERRERRYRHNNINIHGLSDIELRDRYRFGRQSINFITNLLREDLMRSTGRNHSLDPDIQILIALRFFASGSFLQVIDDTFGVDKSTVSRVVRDVCFALTNKQEQFIQWPSDLDKEAAKLNFFQKAGFPCVIGCIDCTHIRIQACKTPSKRNLHGLKINAKAPPVAPSMPSVSNTKTTHKKRPTAAGSLRTILASGQVSHEELQYMEILGHGIGGTVYKCFHTTSQKTMAVKVIPLDLAPEVQKQILLELDILFKCESHFIIGFFGAFFLESLMSICTEYMDGGSLEIYGAIPEPVLGRITVAVVKGLVYLWQLKIMHRDVKPSNILVNTRGQIKLCDFGVSTQLVNSVATTYVGTNAYMAPERVLGGEYSIRSDVWSLGISVVEMALGRFPYCKENSEKKVFLPIELMQCIVNESPPSLPVEMFSPDFVAFVSLSMQKSIKSRPTPGELLEHPFVVLNDDENIEIVSMWVCRKLEEIRGRSHSLDSPNQNEPMDH